MCGLFVCKGIGMTHQTLELGYKSRLFLAERINEGFIAADGDTRGGSRICCKGLVIGLSNNLFIHCEASLESIA
jgi:hypothetical protein